MMSSAAAAILDGMPDPRDLRVQAGDNLVGDIPDQHVRQFATSLISHDSVVLRREVPACSPEVLSCRKSCVSRGRAGRDGRVAASTAADGHRRVKLDAPDSGARN